MMRIATIITFLTSFLFPLFVFAVEFNVPELTEEQANDFAPPANAAGYVQLALFGALALTALLSAFVIVQNLARRSAAIVDEDRQKVRNKIIDGCIGLGVVAVSLLVIAVFYPEMYRFDAARSLFI